MIMKIGQDFIQIAWPLHTMHSRLMDKNKMEKKKTWVFSVETSMATYTAKKLKFVNIRPTVVSDVRYNCWFNSSCCYVIICTGVVPEISVTACMLLNALNNSISFLFFFLLQSLFSIMFTTPPTVNAIFKVTPITDLRYQDCCSCPKKSPVSLYLCLCWKVKCDNWVEM